MAIEPYHQRGMLLYVGGLIKKNSYTYYATSAGYSFADL